MTAKLIAGTEGITQQPFFSPDGKSIGYFSLSDRQLKKIAITGGAPVALCPVTQILGASWSADNSIVFGQFPPGPILRISANGGTPETLIKSGSDLQIFPQILPDGKSVLYTAATIGATQGRIKVQSLKSGESKELFAGGGGMYLPTGHIVYELQNNDNLFAVPFDLDTLEVKGGPIPVVEGVRTMAVSNAATLAYIHL